MLMLRQGQRWGMQASRCGTAVAAASRRPLPPTWAAARSMSSQEGKKKSRWGLKLLGAVAVVGVAGTVLTRKVVMEVDENGTKKLSDVGVGWAKHLPFRGGSRIFGAVAGVHFPGPILRGMIRFYSFLYGCDLTEMSEPLESYHTMGEFFTRRLAEGVRPLADNRLVCPADARVLIVNETDIGDDATVEQVKGVAYPLKTLIGCLPPQDETRSKTKKLYHCILYLAPGDYHGLHSPADWKIDTRRHFPGYLFPVAPAVAAVMPSLFAINERVALTGQWKDGFFSMVAVGATNVGSITLTHEPGFNTNNVDHTVWDGSVVFEHQYLNHVPASRGEELMFFNMGSTVVLVFESEPFEFTVQPGDKVTLGQELGRLKKE